MHDLYSKDLSIKIRQSLDAKIKKGEFVHGSPPFGYVKSSTERNKLVVDKKAAEIVKRIFLLAHEGNSNTKIATILNREGVDTPSVYHKRKGNKNINWTRLTVRKILINETYIGTLIAGKMKCVKFGSKKYICLPKSEWIRIPNAHEAIISANVFQQATANTRPVACHITDFCTYNTV